MDKKRSNNKGSTLIPSPKKISAHRIFRGFAIARLFNEFDWWYTNKSEQGDRPEYNFFDKQDDSNELLTPEIMFRDIFSHGKRIRWFFEVL